MKPPKDLQYASMGDVVIVDSKQYILEMAVGDTTHAKRLVEHWQRSGWDAKFIKTEFNKGVWRISPYAVLRRYLVQHDVSTNEWFYKDGTPA